MLMIKCTDEQAYLIELCLEAMCRASLGQLVHFVESVEKIRGKSFEAKCPDGEVRSFYSLGKYIEEMIKPILFPELSCNESYGVRQKAIGQGQVLYEAGWQFNVELKEIRKPGKVDSKPVIVEAIGKAPLQYPPCEEEESQ